MDLFPYLKSLVDMDRSAVVLCEIGHKIIYMNPAGMRFLAKAFWTAIMPFPVKRYKRQSDGSKRIETIISCILFIMKRKIKMFIWWRFAMKMGN